MEINLSNKTALITGAGGQLCRVMVRTLVSCGARVFVHYLKNKAGVESLVREIRESGGEVWPIQGDVPSRESIEALKGTL
ncbi:MAG: SDR family NAD(P)-dependent oxidoreductase [Spirochaetaceae bacterium]|jgi:3-oxoacyl-[acyl-carrier protein] reductase|nr:SDR family NAD(P)-dependent oxidoreductase [Spirochaetaceae bacterium]